MEDISKEHKIYFNFGGDITKAKYLFDKRTIYLTRYMDERNVIIMNEKFKIEMANQTQYSIRTIKNYINILCKKNILMKEKRNFYVVNKEYFRYYNGE
jgi:hypothetical protein